MKMDENLNKLFNLTPIEKGRENNFVSEINSKEIKKDDDFDLARETMRNLIHKNDAVLNDLVDLARNSESARVYEVAGQLIKTQAEMAKDLMTLHKQKKDIEGDSESTTIKTQNNIVFAGSTSELLKVISAERAKTIDAK